MKREPLPARPLPVRLDKIELANHGTLFLDETESCHHHIQSKLLQLIQEKTIERVSGTKRIELDFRLLVATNRNLEEEVQRGLFRSDLFYRLNVIRVHIPPLRQRLRISCLWRISFWSGSARNTASSWR